jgi:hypothetical protein
MSQQKPRIQQLQTIANGAPSPNGLNWDCTAHSRQIPDNFRSGKNADARQKVEGNREH